LGSRLRNLDNEMVLLAAGLGGAGALARGLPYAAQIGRQGIASLTAPSAEAAAAAVSRSFMHRLGRLPTARGLAQALGLAPDVGINQAEGLGNPFRGRTPEQIDEMFKANDFETRGKDPIGGKGGYVNPRTTRSYYIDPLARETGQGTEFPHVDVNRLRSYPGPLEKKKYPLGDKLYDE
jgi:hypothetical protein